MKKLLALLLSLTLCLGLLAGCGQQEAAPEEDPSAAQTEGELEKVVFTEDVRGYHWAPAYLAESLGYFEEEGLDVSFETIKGGDATTPVLSGDAQFCLKGIETALMVNEAGQGCKIVLSAIFLKEAISLLSVPASRAEVASSKRIIGHPLYMALATASRCIWPSESPAPFSPSSVSYCPGNSIINP